MINFVAALVAALLAAVVVLSVAGTDRHDPGSSQDDARLQSIERTLAGISTRLDQLEVAANPEPRVAVPAHGSFHGGATGGLVPTAHSDSHSSSSLEPGTPSLHAASTGPRERVTSSEEAFESLLAVGQWSSKGGHIWHRAAANGTADEILQIFRQRAEAESHDPEAQADLGDAIAQLSHAETNPVKRLEM
ncbi:MAG: hypothetical protein AAF517_04035, partial [Planctomycetota bacterium]